MTLGLLVFPLLFMIVFLLTCRLMALMGGSGQAMVSLAGQFNTTLIPIAIDYHLAHYLSFLLINGQLLIPLASDPFGFGWDLLGTADYKADIAVVGAKFAWYTSLAILLPLRWRMRWRSKFIVTLGAPRVANIPCSC